MTDNGGSADQGGPMIRSRNENSANVSHFPLSFRLEDNPYAMKPS